jgi:hypothetical protein
MTTTKTRNPLSLTFQKNLAFLRQFESLRDGYNLLESKESVEQAIAAGIRVKPEFAGNPIPNPKHEVLELAHAA